MKIAVGSDHRGYAMKARLRQMLTERGHDVTDMGTDTPQRTDYTDYAEAVARAVSLGETDRGILICGTGIGMAITANKFPGVRAATANDEVTATICRQHNDVNVLCLSGNLLDDQPIDSIVDTWLETEFEGGRHANRVDKIRKIESDLCR